MVEVAFKRFMMMCSGTWAMNVYLRALGAQVGDWATFRLGLCLPLLPDSIHIQSGCAPYSQPHVHCS
jgi:fatty acid synthase